MGNGVQIIPWSGIDHGVDDIGMIQMNQLGLAGRWRQDDIATHATGMAGRMAQWVRNIPVDTAIHHADGSIARAIKGNGGHRGMAEVEQDQRQHHQCPRQLCQIWMRSTHH